MPHFRSFQERWFAASFQASDGGRRLIARHPALLIAGLYLSFGLLWILFSDQALEWLAGGDAPWLSRLQTYKGMAFMVITTVLLFALISASHRVRLRLLQEVAEREAQLSDMAQHIPSVFWILESDLQLHYISPAFEKVWGIPLQDFMYDNLAWQRAILPEDLPTAQRFVDSYLHGKSRSVECKYRIMRPDGEVRWIHDTAYPVQDKEGQLIRIIGVANDITEQKRAHDQLYLLAHFDSLTGLPNRGSLISRLEQACADREHRPFALLFIDLDRFKVINDTLGPHMADHCLRRVASLLEHAFLHDTFTARLGGDEFALMFTEQTNREHLAMTCHQLLALLSHPLEVDGHEVYVGGSIGVACYPQDGETANLLLRHADMAMYAAKQAGRNTFRFYDTQWEQGKQNLELERELHKALQQEEFVLFYQPKFCPITRTLQGFEALLRWRHPERGLVSPALFIPRLEETGLSREGGKWVIHAAFHDLAQWQAAGFGHITMAVNVSARQLDHLNLVDFVQEALERYGLQPQHIELELTESDLMTNPEQSRAIIQGLRQQGIRIAIDDFGTGYSSLAYLKRFAPDTLKIDKSFIDDIDHEHDAAAIVEGIIQLSKILHIHVVAEGVERDSQLQVLARAGCDAVQGFLLGRPMPAVQVMGLLNLEQKLD